MKRLRAVAAILALAVIWLGYSVAREIAAERAWHAPLELKATSEPAPWTEGATSKPVRPSLQFPAVPNSAPRLALTAGADLAPGTSQAITVPSPADAPALPPAQVEPLPTSPAHVPFFQAALFDAQAGATPGAQGRPGGVFGAGGVPSMWGGVGGGSAGSPAATEEAGLSGDGRPGVLGHRFLESLESNEGTGSNESGSNGSNGGSDGSNDHNGDANGNSGSNASNGSNDQNGGGNGKNADNASNGGNGSNGPSENGGDNGATGGGADDGSGIHSFAANVEDKGPNGDVARDIPEPGSILIGLGAVAALLRRRTR
ncbi:MAG TPA: hypothetical protein VGQ37_20095 [Vicinamibacterales bacterium]|jgi:hypothetical protein|nr:hypothetical protein [Vicinamibacterales bacterium]